MRIYETVERTVQQQQCVKFTCDLCGRNGNRVDLKWNTDVYDIAETEIYCKTGYGYPEGGDGVAYEIDICPECFIEKLIPWLQSQGVEVQKHEWDY